MDGGGAYRACAHSSSGIFFVISSLSSTIARAR
jgi:hypothetical protein